MGGSETGASLGEEIRWVFGTFILAFVVAELAKELGRTFIDEKLAAVRGPRFTHLFYTLAVVVMSFWGWSIVIKGGLYADHDGIRSLFQYTNWLFLTDIVIFMTYYLLLLGIEHDGMRAAKWALKCTVAVFAGYFVWDVLVAAWPGHGDPLSWWGITTRHMYASFLCGALAGLGFFAVRKTRSSGHAIYGTYAALFLLMLGFRFMTVSIHAQPERGAGFRAAWIACLVLAAGVIAYVRRRKAP